MCVCQYCRSYDPVLPPHLHLPASTTENIPIGYIHTPYTLHTRGICPGLPLHTKWYMSRTATPYKVVYVQDCHSIHSGICPGLPLHTQWYMSRTATPYTWYMSRTATPYTWYMSRTATPYTVVYVQDCHSIHSGICPGLPLHTQWYMSRTATPYTWYMSRTARDFPGLGLGLGVGIFSKTRDPRK